MQTLWGWVRVRLLPERSALEPLPGLGAICLFDGCGCANQELYSWWGDCSHYREFEGVGREPWGWGTEERPRKGMGGGSLLGNLCVVWRLC